MSSDRSTGPICRSPSATPRCGALEGLASAAFFLTPWPDRLGDEGAVGRVWAQCVRAEQAGSDHVLPGAAAEAGRRRLAALRERAPGQRAHGCRALLTRFAPSHPLPPPRLASLPSLRRFAPFQHPFLSAHSSVRGGGSQVRSNGCTVRFFRAFCSRHRRARGRRCSPPRAR